MKLHLKHILWAVDVFEESVTHRRPLSFVKNMSSKLHNTVELAHILNFAYVPPRSEVPSWGEALRVMAETKLEELAAASELANIKTTILPVEDGGSTRKNVEILIQHAKKTKADAIVVSTHARTGLSRMVLGSFAETLLLQSPIPVLTVNPGVQGDGTISTMLLPTYFTQECHSEFQTVLALAGDLGANLTLYYKEPLPLTGSFAVPAGMYDQTTEEIGARRQIAAKWEHEAQKHGVKGTVVLDEVPGNVSSAITEYAKDKHIDLITMFTRSDRLATVLIGSATRQVVRESSCPVLAIRSEG